MYFHRLVIDFSHDVEKPQFTEFFDEIVESLMSAIVPHCPGAECGQDVWISGRDVTEEYDELYGTGVQELRKELEDDTVLDEFFKNITFKDYPPRERED